MGTPERVISETEVVYRQQARTAVSEFRLVESGAFTYQELGFALSDGRISNVKVHEHMVIQSAVDKAREQHRRNAKG